MKNALRRSAHALWIVSLIVLNPRVAVAGESACKPLIPDVVNVPVASESLPSNQALVRLYEQDQQDRAIMSAQLRSAGLHAGVSGGTLVSMPDNDSVPLRRDSSQAYLYGGGAPAEAWAKLPPDDTTGHLDRNDTQRRESVLSMLDRHELRSADDLFLAAMIFQHGDCPRSYQLAHQLAKAAMDGGSEKAKKLVAMTMDRYLLSTGKPQKFGTQYTLQGGQSKLRPVDPTTTDAERAKYNVPTLEDAKNHPPSL